MTSSKWYVMATTTSSTLHRNQITYVILLIESMLSLLFIIGPRKTAERLRRSALMFLLVSITADALWRLGCGLRAESSPSVAVQLPTFYYLHFLLPDNLATSFSRLTAGGQWLDLQEFALYRRHVQPAVASHAVSRKRHYYTSLPAVATDTPQCWCHVNL